jgi:glycosyltransferase involved in cell wall biosynthesis
MPAVHQVLASLGSGDAIGHEVLGIRRVLRAAGYASEIFVETADARLAPATLDYREMTAAVAPDDLVIHHFSIGSRASRTAFAVPSRMILVYHNITPPRYFLGEHPWLVRQCYHGRRELLAYRSRVELAVGDSEFNRQELEALGFTATGVLPVVPDFSPLETAPDPRIIDAFDDETANVLFVGRLIPHKRPDLLIRYLQAYRTVFRKRARLLLAGSHDQFGGFLAELHALAARLGAGDVHILGQVTSEELTALYDVADLFLCASEHEGFCVPIVEAFYKRVPVIARAATAVPATMDGGGLLFDGTDPLDVAALMDAVLMDEALEDRVLRAQDAALARLLARDFGQTLLGFVRQVQAAPARPAAPVDPDFWRQFQLADELEEVREGRPSAFHALPSEPDRARRLADVGDRA